MAFNSKVYSNLLECHATRMSIVNKYKYSSTLRRKYKLTKNIVNDTFTRTTYFFPNEIQLTNIILNYIRAKAMVIRIYAMS